MLTYQDNILLSLGYSKIREELGMKLLSRDKFPSLSSPSSRETKLSMRKVAFRLWTKLKRCLNAPFSCEPLTDCFYFGFSDAHSGCSSAAAERFGWRGSSHCAHSYTEPTPDVHTGPRHTERFTTDTEDCWHPTLKQKHRPNTPPHTCTLLLPPESN